MASRNNAGYRTLQRMMPKKRHMQTRQEETCHDRVDQGQQDCNM
jgi:hypothetical protein